MSFFHTWQIGLFNDWNEMNPEMNVLWECVALILLLTYKSNRSYLSPPCTFIMLELCPHMCLSGPNLLSPSTYMSEHAGTCLWVIWIVWGTIWDSVVWVTGAEENHVRTSCVFLMENTTSGGMTVSTHMVLCVCSYVCIFKQELILYYSDVFS